jgi:CHAT domain-containing protein
MLVPYALRNLGLLAGISGDLPQARAHLEAALEAFRRDTPGNPIEGQILYELGALALRQGRLAEAERRQRESREIRRRLAPRTDSEAESLFGLGDVRRSQGRVKEAVALWSEAVAILEAHGAHITDSAQGRLSFSAYHNDVFHELTGLLLETGAPERAFQMLERSRGRALRAMLAERNLAFSAAEVPGELLRRQQQLDGEYDRLLQRQAELRATDQKAVADLLTQLEDLRQNRDLVAKQVREAMPRLGALQHPEPLDLQGALRALDPGTLLLSYSCGSTRSLLFVLAGGVNGKHALRTFVLPVTRDALQDRVEIFRKLLARGQDVAALDAQARRLFDDLLGPARPLVAASRRLLIVPDGPLHALPFAALVDSTGPHYLVELKPLHVAPSLTVYAELMRPRAETARPAGPPLVAFGAPDYGTTAAGAEAALANPSLAARAQRLGPLPASAGEVADIAALYPGAITYVGGQATEEKAKTLPAGTRILHFATHALLDGRRPLDSALVLSRTPNGSENGLFQAWEIFERLRVDADLVTLAACDTGLGRDMGGEGLISLARAFQFAGARSVLASLWAVDDAPTATLMKSFYAGLRHGSTKDEALQAAQLEALRRTPSARSFHWAAFELSGAWN